MNAAETYKTTLDNATEIAVEIYISIAAALNVAFDEAAATATEAYAATDAAHNEVKAVALEVYKASAALEVYKASAAIEAYEARQSPGQSMA